MEHNRTNRTELGRCQSRRLSNTRLTYTIESYRRSLFSDIHHVYAIKLNHQSKRDDEKLDLIFPMAIPLKNQLTFFASESHVEYNNED